MQNKLITFDVVIIAKSSEPELITMTQECIDSLRADRINLKSNIIVIETGPIHIYKHADLIKAYPESKFNYNKALNYGFQFCKNQYILFCNNDLYFHFEFEIALMKGFEAGYLSLSPFNRRGIEDRVPIDIEFLEGYRIGSRIMGWCIAVDRKIFDSIGKFDEGVDFWYSDHLYAHQIKKAGIKHALCLQSYVEHLESKTLNLCTLEDSIEKQYGQIKKYEESKKRILG